MNALHAGSISPPGVARLEALAVRRGLTLGVLASASPTDFALLLAAAGCAFAPGETLVEREVNERLKSFLAGAGAMLAVDHVELRRWLVDNAVLARDGFGRAYTRGTPGAQIAQAMVALAGFDLARIVAQARDRDAAKRAERKRVWQASQ
jgi:hypothetical protein